MKITEKREIDAVQNIVLLMRVFISKADRLVHSLNECPQGPGLDPPGSKLLQQDTLTSIFGNFSHLDAHFLKILFIYIFM